MGKLVRILRLAHAIEIGAYEAYEGHWRTVKNDGQRKILQRIQKDEWFHKQAVGFMLIELEAKSNKFLDSIMYFIGKSVSISCYVIGYRAAMWGAKLFEIMGSGIYRQASAEAFKIRHIRMYRELWEMNRTEKEHEEFFKMCLKQDQEAKKGLVP